MVRLACVLALLVPCIQGCRQAAERGVVSGEANGGPVGHQDRPAARSLAQAGEQLDVVPAEAAWALVRLDDRHTLAQAHPDILETPVAPGSLMKLVALVAAVDAGLVTRGTRLACRRRLRVDGRVLDCSHPDLGHPLDAVEAIAHSCNTFFAEVGRRLSAAQLSRASQRLGLPPVVDGPSPVLAVLGLGRYEVAPRRWIDAVARIVSAEGAEPGRFATAGALAREGLAGAARFGTAAPFASEFSAMVKTGTAPMPGGATEGLAVALVQGVPSDLGLVVVAPGAAGGDAATIAATILRQRAEVVRAADRRWPLWLRVGVASPAGSEIRRVALEDYVAQVVSGEMSADAPPAALEAMAIVSRSFAVSQQGRHEPEGFDVCDLTHCQALRPATGPGRQAAARTAGRTLAWNGQPAEVYYTASCGGRSAQPGDVWPRTAGAWPAFLAARTDPAGERAREIEWVVELDASQLLTALRAAGLRGDQVTDLAVADREPFGRARTLQARGLVPERVSAEVFRVAAGRVLGWHVLKSTWFDLVRTARGYRFIGRGHGHGVGLCVRGATALAAAGEGVERILEGYFPGTAIVTAVAPPSRRAALPSPAHVRDVAPVSPSRSGRRDDRGATHIRLVLPAADEGQRARVFGQLRRTLTHVSARLGEPPPATLTVRFHPTVQSYERASHRPWWTAATTRGTTTELLPLQVLDDQHQLERTLRHELVHVATANALEGKPRWMVEGVAHYFAMPAGLAREEDTGAIGCPDDHAFDQAGSAEALAEVYERAARCVARALRDGHPWHRLPQ